MTVLVALCFVLEYPNMRTSVFVTNKIFIKLTKQPSWYWIIHIYLCAHIHWNGSSETPRVNTISVSLMELYYCWSSKFPSDLYNLLIISRNIFSYEEILLDYWSTAMVTICCLSCYNFNTLLSCVNIRTLIIISNIFSCRALIISVLVYQGD